MQVLFYEKGGDIQSLEQLGLNAMNAATIIDALIVQVRRRLAR